MDETTIVNWELGHRTPVLRHMPGTIRFVGCVPFPVGDCLPQRLRAYRRIHGISRKKLAGIFGVDEGTLWR